MSTFLCSVSSVPKAVSCPDNKTLIIKHFSGTATLSFASAAEMMAVCTAIQAAMVPNSPFLVPTTPVAEDALVNAANSLRIHEDEDEAAGSSETESDAGDSQDEAVATVVQDPDSYEGHGMTQDAW